MPGKHGPMMLGGHRGMGENLATRGLDGQPVVHPAFRENTIHSFQQAAKCGVGFVEFDVHVTRDNIPIIWHDDDVVFGPDPDHPMRPAVKDLTLAELQSLCGRHSHSHHNDLAAAAANPSAGCPACAAAAAAAAAAAPAGADAPSSAAPPSSSPPSSRGGSADLRQLLRQFRDRSTRQHAKGYARWSCAEDDTIPTLESVFRALPPDIGFDIEVKMAVPDDVVHTPAEEVDRMLNAILPVVQRCASRSNQQQQQPSSNRNSSASSASAAGAAPGGGGGGGMRSNASSCDGADAVNNAAAATSARAPASSASSTPSPGPEHGPSPGPEHGRMVVFSSFDPDVCVELRRRQSSHPVYYLSGCGLYEHADARRTSIPAALEFAAEAGMRGVVVPASVLMKNMDMVASAERSRLELMTYGLENNDLDCLRAQADAGVAAAIVDEVESVMSALAAGEEAVRRAEAKEEAAGAGARAAA